MGAIRLRLNVEVARQVADKTMAKDLWTKLRDLYGGTSAMGAFSFFKAAINVRIPPHEHPSSAIAKIQGNLDELHNTLALPTKQQEQEQVFALNADQYNSLTTFDDAGVDYKHQQPSNLQQALAAMRGNVAHKLPNKATSEVYSRSLMWDRVPEKVIRDFRRMVQEYGVAPVKEEDSGFSQ